MSQGFAGALGEFVRSLFGLNFRQVFGVGVSA